MNTAYKTALTRKRKNKAARHIQKAVRASQTIKKAKVGSAAAKRDYYIVKIKAFEYLYIIERAFNHQIP